jgi:hypothetical protein
VDEERNRKSIVKIHLEEPSAGGYKNKIQKELYNNRHTDNNKDKLLIRRREKEAYISH